MSLGTMTQEEAHACSKAVFEKLASRDRVLEKQAEDTVNDFTRYMMREDGIYRKIMPPVPISNDQLDRQSWTTKPVKIVDKEPRSPAAISIPFATLPMNLYIKGPRYSVMFDRIATTKFTCDVDDLRTWIMDIRQVLSDNAIKDMQAEEDGKFLRAVNTAVVGPGLTVPTSGTVQHKVLNGGITRNTLAESLKTLPNTPSSLEVVTVLCNNITIKDAMKFGHDEAGGTISQDILRDGWTLKRFLGCDWLITIKKGLVPTNTMYHFAAKDWIGKNFQLEDTTMYKTEYENAFSDGVQM